MPGHNVKLHTIIEILRLDRLERSIYLGLLDYDSDVERRAENIQKKLNERSAKKRLIK